MFVPSSDLLSSLEVKYLFLNDSSRDVRENYVMNIFDGQQVVRRYPIYDLTVPRSNSETDVLVIGGNDHRRMICFLKANMPLFSRIPKICILEKAKISDRVDLLDAGFDAVINSTQIQPKEAANRIGAIVARYATLYLEEEEEAHQLGAYGECVEYENLNRQEKILFGILFDNVGRIVSYDKLQDQVSLDHQPIQFSHLRVLICSLRRKLKPGWWIRSLRSEGYQMSKG